MRESRRKKRQRTQRGKVDPIPLYRSVDIMRLAREGHVEMHFARKLCGYRHGTPSKY